MKGNVHVFIIAAISVDGFISPAVSTSSITWTSQGDKHFFGERTKQARVLVMGRTTFETIGRPLKDRLVVVMSSQPKPEQYTQFDDSQVRFSSDSPEQIVQTLTAEGFTELAICGGSSIYAQFMKAGLVNRLYLTVEPIAFGKGIPLFKEELGMQKLALIDAKKIDDSTLLLEYSVEK